MSKCTLRLGLLGATLLVGAGGIALAQTPPTYDPAQLPAFHGKVAQYDLTPRGDVDGLILDDGTEVHFPPHLGTQVVATVKPGDVVTVHGLKARELNLVQAMSVASDANPTVVVAIDAGGPMHHRGPGPGFGPGMPANAGPERGPGPDGGHGPGDHGPGDHGPGFGPRGEMRGDGGTMEVHGAVKMQLHGPRGDVNGVLLTDGTMVHMPPPAAARLAAQLAPGQTVFVRGDGSASVLGKSVEARSIGSAADQMTPIRPPHPGHGEMPPDAPPPAAK